MSTANEHRPCTCGRQRTEVYTSEDLRPRTYWDRTPGTWIRRVASGALGLFGRHVDGVVYEDATTMLDDAYEKLLDAHERLGGPLNQITTDIDIKFSLRDRLRVLFGRWVRVRCRVAIDRHDIHVHATRASTTVDPIIRRRYAGVVLAGKEP